MNPSELMTVLAKNEDSFLQAIITSVRHVRYGKHEFEYFESLSELYATLKFLYDLTDETNNREWKQMKCLYTNLISNDLFDNNISFDDLENALFDEIKVLINLAANVRKAKESISLNTIQSKNIKEEL